MKLKYLIYVLFIGFTSCAINPYNYFIKQKTINDVSIGLSNYKYDTKNSISTTPSISVSFYNIYFDISNNFAFGKGTEYSLTSKTIRNLDKVNVGTLNIGYNITLNKNNIIIPTIGYAYKMDIYKDPNYPDCFYRYLEKTNINLGLNFKMYKKHKKVGIMMGIGTIERFKFSLVFKY
jgi:hypothetical protein